MRWPGNQQGFRVEAVDLRQRGAKLGARDEAGGVVVEGLEQLLQAAPLLRQPLRLEDVEHLWRAKGQEEERHAAHQRREHRETPQPAVLVRLHLCVAHVPDVAREVGEGAGYQHGHVGEGRQDRVDASLAAIGAERREEDAGSGGAARQKNAETNR